MSKNNQNNNRSNYNNHGGRNNFNDRKKVAKQPKVNPNEIKVPLYLPADLDENIANEILDVLAVTKFDKISIPLGTYRCLIDSNVDENDTRLSTIGYLRGYNPESKEFTVIIFSKFTDLVKEQGNIVLELQFSSYKNKLGTITKFNIVPVLYEEASEDNNETNE